MVLLRRPVLQKDGICIFAPSILQDHKDYNADGLEILHRSENKHFGSISRRERICSLFEKYVSRKENIPEIGAGTGNVPLTLMNSGYNIAAGEIHINGLRFARRSGIKKCYQFDLFDPPFADHFKELKRIAAKAGFEVIYSHYFFSAIFPLLVIRHFARPDNGSPFEPAEYNYEIRINPLLNRFLLAICRLENKIFPLMPNCPGGSIIMAAGKRDD